MALFTERRPQNPNFVLWVQQYFVFCRERNMPVLLPRAMYEFAPGVVAVENERYEIDLYYRACDWSCREELRDTARWGLDAFHGLGVIPGTRLDLTNIPWAHHECKRHFQSIGKEPLRWHAEVWLVPARF